MTFSRRPKGKGTYRVWDAQNATEMHCFPGYVCGTGSVAFTHTGELIIPVGGDRFRSFEIWNLLARRKKAILHGTHNDPHVIALSSDGKWIAVVELDGYYSVYNAQTGKIVRRFRGINRSRRRAIAATARNGRFIVSLGVDKSLTVWDVSSWQNRRPVRKDVSGKRVMYVENTESVSALAMSADARSIVTANYDGSLTVWDVKAGTKKATLSGHDSAIFSVAFSPDGKRIVSGSEDETVRVWNAKPLEEARGAGQ